MPASQPLTTKIWCTTSFLQVGQVTTASLFWKRAPQRPTPGGNNAAATISNSTSPAEAAPMVVYPSGSGLNSSNQEASPSSPRDTASKILLATLSGASAISVITLAFLIIYRKYKSRKGVFGNLGVSSLSLRSPHRKAGFTTVEKSTIRHVTHDEQRERYISLFGVPAGYLRPKSRILQAPPAVIPSLHIIRCSESLQNFRADAQRDQRYSFGDESQFSCETSPFEFATTEENLKYPQEVSRESDIRFEEGGGFSVLSSVPIEEDKLRVSRLFERFPNIAARLKTLREKSTRRTSTNSGRKEKEFSNRPILCKNLPPIFTGIEEIDWNERRSPSIAPTPPSYLKSPSSEDMETQQTIDMASVSDRLQRQMTVARASFQGRGDSYYWKSPIRSDWIKKTGTTCIWFL